MSDFPKVCLNKRLPDDAIEKTMEKAIEENPANSPFHALKFLNINTNKPIAPKIVGEKLKFWRPGRTLKIKFLDGHPEIQRKVKEHAMEWTRYANIHFKFIQNGDAEIRISFKQKGFSWSLVGTDCLDPRLTQNDATMNYGWFTLDTDDEEYSRTVLHEFGHALGLHHEQMRPDSGIPWDKEAVYRDYMRCNIRDEDPCWTKEEVDSNVFDMLDLTLMNYSRYDKDSIMQYPIPDAHTIGHFEIGLNTQLSALDKEFIGKFYPFDSASIAKVDFLNETSTICEKENTKNQTKKCSEIPAVDIECIPLKNQLKEARELQRKVMYFPGVTHVGDCDIWNMVLTLWSDGKANFTADVRSTDSDDAWVFYGGISLWDTHGVFLWNSQKIVGPSMDGHHSKVMDVTFYYPAHLYNSITGAKIQRMHC